MRRVGTKCRFGAPRRIITIGREGDDAGPAHHIAFEQKASGQRWGIATDNGMSDRHNLETKRPQHGGRIASACLMAAIKTVLSNAAAHYRAR